MNNDELGTPHIRSSDTSVLAVFEVDLLPSTEVNESDTGALVGAELGVRAVLCDSWAAELRGT